MLEASLSPSLPDLPAKKKPKLWHKYAVVPALDSIPKMGFDATEDDANEEEVVFPVKPVKMDSAATAADSTTSALLEHVDRLMSANVDMQATSTTSPEAPPVEPPEPLGLVPANVDMPATSTTSPEAPPVEPPEPLGLVPANVDMQATSTTSPEAAPAEPLPPLPAPDEPPESPGPTGPVPDASQPAEPVEKTAVTAAVSEPLDAGNPADGSDGHGAGSGAAASSASVGGPANMDVPPSAPDVTNNFLQMCEVNINPSEDPAPEPQKTMFFKAGLIVPGIALKKFKLAALEDQSRSQSFAGALGEGEITMYKTQRPKLTGLCMGDFTSDPAAFWHWVRHHLREKPVAAVLIFDGFSLTMEDAPWLCKKNLL